MSRHYYDLYRLLNSTIGQKAALDMAIEADCVAHAQMFFYRKDFDLADAKPGAFTLTPSEEMIPALRADYRAMSGMIFGAAPGLEDIIDTIRHFETQLNQA